MYQDVRIGVLRVVLSLEGKYELEFDLAIAYN